MHGYSVWGASNTGIPPIDEHVRIEEGHALNLKGGGDGVVFVCISCMWGGHIPSLRIMWTLRGGAHHSPLHPQASWSPPAGPHGVRQDAAGQDPGQAGQCALRHVRRHHADAGGRTCFARFACMRVIGRVGGGGSAGAGRCVWAGWGVGVGVGGSHGRKEVGAGAASKKTFCSQKKFSNPVTTDSKGEAFIVTRNCSILPPLAACLLLPCARQVGEEFAADAAGPPPPHYETPH